MKTCDLLCGGLHGGWSELERGSYALTVPVLPEDTCVAEAKT